MEYTATSIKEVIGRIVRNLDNKLPGHYLDPMLEWIPEAIDQMETPYTLVRLSTPDIDKLGALFTDNYCVKLPCGLVSLLAVEDAHGNRLFRTGQQTSISSHTALGRTYENPARTTDFITHTDTILNGDENGPSVPWDGSNIKPAEFQPVYATYDIKFNYLQTSEECMYVKVHYEALPVDKEGYPLIPNVTEYKEALYWWVMSKLIGFGFQHPTIPQNLTGIEYCLEKFELYAARALGKIKMPDQDRMAKLNHSFVRLVPPTHFYEDFFIGSSQIQPVRFV